MTKKEKEVYAGLVVGMDGVKGRLGRVEEELRRVVTRQELAFLEINGRLERCERVIAGMMGQGVYRSDLEVMKKWMGNRWVVPRGEGFGLAKKNGVSGSGNSKRRSKRGSAGNPKG